ncbi:Fc.00g025320.m01.CDS01 [Cosmosporella sp. VM-42]
MVLFATKCLFLALAVLPTAWGKAFRHNSKPPDGWSPAHKNPNFFRKQQIFTIALTMKNIGQIENKLLELSTPGNPKYGQWMTEGEVNTMFSPSKKAVSDVAAWLKSFGVKNYKVDGAFIDFAADVYDANTLLGADYQYYVKNGTTKLRTLSFSIPDTLAQHIQYIDPSTNFGKSVISEPVVRATGPPLSRRDELLSNWTVDADCRINITPLCLKEMYNIGNYTADAKSGSSIGFSTFLNGSALYRDIFLFEDMFGIPKQNFSTVLVNNATNDQNPWSANYREADLDAETIVGIAHPLPFTEYITGGSPPFVPNINQPTAADNTNEPYLPYLRYLMSQRNKDLPAVISNSYGENEDSVPREYATLACNLMGLAGLRGITMIFSSGDTGIGSSCLAPDYKTAEFNGIFPATCPWLTSVGGTVGVAPESAWDGSSGGFSKYFPRPRYQDSAVNAYMQNLSSEVKTYFGTYTNWAGRGFPDVAAHSVLPYFRVIYAEGKDLSGGTSASAPIWGGIVGLLNDARFRVGKSKLGWLNPLIYKHGSDVLTDITDGSSIGCNGFSAQTGLELPTGSKIIPGARWNATAGWDPVTGFGTPDFGKLKQLVLKI